MNKRLNLSYIVILVHTIPAEYLACIYVLAAVAPQMGPTRRLTVNPMYTCRSGERRNGRLAYEHSSSKSPTHSRTLSDSVLSGRRTWTFPSPLCFRSIGLPVYAFLYLHSSQYLLRSQIHAECHIFRPSRSYARTSYGGAFALSTSHGATCDGAQLR